MAKPLKSYFSAPVAKFNVVLPCFEPNFVKNYLKFRSFGLKLSKIRHNFFCGRQCYLSFEN
jgi:hypothetical protein